MQCEKHPKQEEEEEEDEGEQQRYFFPQVKVTNMSSGSGSSPNCTYYAASELD